MTEDNNLGLEFKYLIVNDMDRKFGLWVNTVGYQSIPPDSPYPVTISMPKKEEYCGNINWSILQKGAVCFLPILLLKDKFVKVG